jgi:hypothetical protein
MSSVTHDTVPVQVWVSVDKPIAGLVKYLNMIEGVRTYACCQGTIGEGGPEPYRPFVSVGWESDAVRDRLKSEFEIVEEGANFGMLHLHDDVWMQ